MSNNESELSAEVERILTKSFDDARKKILTLIIKREKRLLKEAASSAKGKVPASSRATSSKGKSRRSRDDYHRSHSASESDE